MNPSEVNFINQLTLAAAAMIACGFLWRAYKGAMDMVVAAKDAHLQDLRALSEKSLTDVRARVMVLEDKTGVDRKARFDYMPAGSAHEQEVLLNLDNVTEKTFLRPGQNK